VTGCHSNKQRERKGSANNNNKERDNENRFCLIVYEFDNRDANLIDASFPDFM
jgi:hypothetical protein